MLKSILLRLFATRSCDMVGRHILVRPTALRHTDAVENLRRSVEKAHSEDGHHWVVYDLRGEWHQSHKLNSISGRQKTGAEAWVHRLVVVDRDFSIQSSLDISRAAAAGVTVAMAAKRPSEFDLVNSLRFSQVAQYFAFQAVRSRRGHFWFIEFTPPERHRETPYGYAHRRRPTRGERAYGLRNHDW